MNKFGYYLILLFFIFVPFHFWLSEYLSYYYKEFFAIFFSILTIPLIKKKNYFFDRSEFIFIFIFLIYLVLCSFLFNSRILYPDDNIPINLSVSLDLYVIRNALLYIPMLLYIFKRGLNQKEIHFILKVISVFGVISIVAFLVFYDIISDVSSILNLFALGGDKLQYNSFVPYLTFPFAASFYLGLCINNYKTKLFFYFLALLIFSYIVLSTSRQSIIFCFIIFVLFLTFNGANFKSSIKIFFPILVFLILALPSYLKNVLVSENLINKTTSLQGLTSDDTGRFELVVEGLNKLYFVDFIVGAGVSSVMFSGPHNDYIRWIQKIGIFGAFLGFLPFLISFIGSLKLMRKKHSIYHTFVFIVILYTIYISFFGYPREDAYQAPYVWLGLSFWLLIIKKKNNIRE